MRKKEGFHGQRAFIIPESIIQEQRSDPVASLLFVTDIGYYPKAAFHYRERKHGCTQNILVYCADGQGWIRIGHRLININKHQYFILPKGLPHIYGTVNTEPWSIYWVHFEGTQAAFFLEKNVNAKIVGAIRRNVAPDYGNLFEEILRSFSMGFSRENLEYGNICLWHILGSFKYQVQFHNSKEVVYEDRIEKSIHYMKEHMAEPFNLKTLAKESGFSVSHYCNVFKKRTSRTPLDYFMQLKMQEACRWLDFTDLKVVEVAEKAGFRDPYYFSRVFTKVMGLPPSLYKKKIKG